MIVDLREKTIAKSEAAYLFWLNGFNPLPVHSDGSKRPALRSWEVWQRVRVPENILEDWFSYGNDVGIICGAISGGLVVIDFDEKNERGNFEKWARAIDRSWLKRLPIIRTPSGGFHAYMRCGAKIGNLKLARSEDGKTLIETKAEGGYVLGPIPSSVGLYEQISGPAVATACPVVTEAELDELLAVARSLNRYTEAKGASVCDTREHSEAIGDDSLPPMKDRAAAARRYCQAVPPSQAGNDASGRCFWLACVLVWQFALDEDHAIDVLYEWGQSGIDQYGSPYPWRWGEIRHKVQDAIRATHTGRCGWRFESFSIAKFIDSIIKPFSLREVTNGKGDNENIQQKIFNQFGQGVR